MLQRIAYVRIFVTDLDRAVTFYESVLGLKLVNRLDDFAWAEFALPGGDARLGVEVSPDGESVGRFVGVSLEADDIDAEHQRLTAAGVCFTCPPKTMPWGGRLASLVDPDGNELTLLQSLPAAH